MSGFNGVRAIADNTEIVPILSDACVSGGGAFCHGDFVYFNWECDFVKGVNLPINYKEAVTAAMGVIRWAPVFNGHTLYVYLDNQCAVAIINKCDDCYEVITGYVLVRCIRTR